VRAQALQSAAVQAAAYSPEDRRALAMLLLPFLIVATALAGNHAWRTTRAYLPDLPALAQRVPPVPIEPKVAVRPPDMSRTPLPMEPKVAGPELAVSNPPPLPLPVKPEGDAANGDRLAAPTPRVELMRPPAAPTLPPRKAGDAATEFGPVCLPAATERLAQWSTRTSRVALGQSVADQASGSEDFGVRLAQAARAQTKDLVIYNARYQSIAYPLGDLPGFYGACSDVIIRAFRAVGVDLQQLVQQSHVGHGDRSIDHRRTETLRRFFARQGASLEVTPFPEDYKPGDVVTYYRPFSRVSNAHIAVVSDVLAPTGRPMIVHNRGWGPQLEDALFIDRITGHYRFVPKPAAEPAKVAAGEGPRRLIRGRQVGRAKTTVVRGSLRVSAVRIARHNGP
jgi:uncharacterized protein YijF (DUF1287 family)